MLHSYIDYEKRMPELYAPDKMDPERPARLLKRLGAPHEAHPAIHIAGTKGKGSVAAMIAFALRAAGLRVGLYTSPHLVDLRERIRVLSPDDAEGRIDRRAFAAAFAPVHAAAAGMAGITWFELLTAVAFVHFQAEAVDAAVLEVGLGGRLDATNVVAPAVSVITSISFDHMALLGHTLAAIAGEKGGIIKAGVPAASAPQAPEALERLARLAAERAAPLTVVGRDVHVEVLSEQPSRLRLRDGRRPDSALERLELTVPLVGAHQRENAAVAAVALELARPALPAVSWPALAAGIAETRWPGRFQILREPDAAGPGLVLDGAHNGDSAARLADAVRARYPGARVHLLVAVTQDKQIAAILAPLLPLADTVIATQAAHPRAAAASAVVAAAADLGVAAGTSPDPASGLLALLRVAAPGDLVLVTGSLFLVGDLLNQWERLQSASSSLGD